MRVASAKSYGGYSNLVIVNIGLRLGQPDGLRVRDEVHLVAALRQFQAQLGCDYTAAAVGGITGDSDFHASWLTDWMDLRRRRFSCMAHAGSSSHKTQHPISTSEPGKVRPLTFSA
jgi:hypothetical protein